MIFINNNRSQLQKNESWKTQTNSIIVPKKIFNNSTGNSSNSNDVVKMKWPSDCEYKSKYKFNPNPIKHYRKQYGLANSFSNSSIIGFLDKPGNYIVTDSSNCKNCAGINSQNLNIHFLQDTDNFAKSGDWTYEASLNKMVCTACNPQTMVIKRATTILNKEYSSSNREYLYKKCKTFDQNALKTHENVDCKNHPFNCNPTIKYSNRKYGISEPVSSSSRISALKYGCSNPNNRRCVIRRTDFNDSNLCGDLTPEECKNKEALQNPGCVGCIKDNKIRRKRINILH